MTNPDYTSPFAWKSISIRGIGSYGRGARLDIKPLTILCGTNGSGKSTWLQALWLLKRSLEQGRLPFSYIDNTIISEPAEQHDQFIDDPMQEQLFGAVGTISVEFVVTSEYYLEEGGSHKVQETDDSNALIYEGKCTVGSCLKLTVCHSSRDHYFSLSLDERLVYRVTGGVLECAGTLIGDNSASLVRCARISASKRMKNGFDIIENRTSMSKHLPSLCILRFIEILRTALDGFFYISAERKTERAAHIRDISAHTDVFRKRWVGSDGKYTHPLIEQYATNQFFQPKPPHYGFIDYTFKASIDAHVLFTQGSTSLFSQYISSLPRPVQEQLSLLRSKIDSASSTGHVETGTALQEELNAMLTTILNGSLHDCDFLKNADNFSEFSASLRILLSSKLTHDKDTEFVRRLALNEILAPALAISSSDTPPSPSLDLRAHSPEYKTTYELIRDDAFSDRPSPGTVVSALFNRLIFFNFDLYYNTWLDKLTGVSYLPELGVPFSPWEVKEPLPAGFMQDFNNGRYKKGKLPNYKKNDPRYNSYSHPTMQSPSPRYFSTGFHQIAPILVQAILMKKGELAAIENPEAHLHPALQINIAEFLISESRIGKYLLIETHSDLIIRRVLRAIIEEEMSQHEVGIYFTALKDCESEDEDDNRSFSVITPIAVDTQGRVMNWPEGFMDADVLESRRLIEIMYGKEVEDE